MFKNKLFRIIWWGIFTLIIDIFALSDLSAGRVNSTSLIGATVMSGGFIYLLATYKK